MRILFIFCCLLLSGYLSAQKMNLDSLLQVAENKSYPDSVRIEVYSNIGWALKNTDNKKAEVYTLKSIAMANKSKIPLLCSNGYNNLGVIYNIRGEHDNSIRYFIRSLQIKDSIFEKRGSADKTLKKAIATTCNNIGNAYRIQQDYKKALEYLERSVKLKLEIDDRKSLALSLINIGNIYSASKEFEKARVYFRQALAISQEYNSPSHQAMAYHNLAFSFDYKTDTDSALYYSLLAIKIKETLNDPIGLQNSLTNLSSIYLEMGQLQKALENSKKAYLLVENSGAKNNIKNCLINLGSIYFQMGEYKEAYEHLWRANIYRDSLYNEENAKSINEMAAQYESNKKEREIVLLQKEKQLSLVEAQRNANEVVLLNKEKELSEITIKNNRKSLEILRKENQLKAIENEKKEKQIELNEKEKKLQEAQLSRERFIRNIFIGGIIALILFSFVIINRFRITKKQKHIIELQKQVVEEKQKEIVDSITYAKRIQTAILPPLRLIQGILPDSFVLYKPKDIVAGDFYWLHTISGEEDLILFAAADCTGHGVPGAMVSVVCHNALNRSVREYGLQNPGKILDKTREIVIHEFEKGEGLTSFTKSSEDTIKDGMDISLVCLSPKTKKLSYAGANNPLWIIRNHELIEIKADKQPIGKYVNAKPFTTHDIQLESGDAIYFFTDGYADQFGGDQGKKFKGSKMKELLLSLSDQKMKNQKEELNTAFEKWRGKLEQIDDVCVIGVRL